MRFGLVIFDCDGVLVDSEPIANRVFAERLGAYGLPMSPEEVMRTFVGRSRDTCIEMVNAMRGTPLPPGFAASWDAALHEAIAREVQAVPGVARALEMPCCVASNGEPSHMQVSLTTTAIAAGMRVFAYAAGAHTDRAKVAALGATPFTSMAELPALLEAA